MDTNRGAGRRERRDAAAPVASSPGRARSSRARCGDAGGRARV